MPHSAASLKSPISYFHGHSSHPLFSSSQNHRLNISIFTPFPHLVLPVLRCTKGVVVSVPRNSHNASSSALESAAPDWKLSSAGVKDIDVATLGNLCVDIVLNVPSLPPSKAEDRRAYMERLLASPPDKRNWEAGGNCNMAIAAARLGLSCLTIGHVGDEIYGQFLLDVLHNEGIDTAGMTEDNDLVDSSCKSYETLLCWVLVDPFQRHGFCSRADFNKEPAFNWIGKLSAEVKGAIKRSKVLFCNGYGFDELSPKIIISTMEYALEVGTSIFFDPGPRGRSLSCGTPDERMALNKFLTMSDVLLLTSDEAESLTGVTNPILAGQELLKKGVRIKWVIVKMGSRGSILIKMTNVACAPAFQVNVIDTVGCGDSFVAAVAFGFIHNLPTIHTLTLANAVGAATAMGCGAGRNVATLENVLKLMTQSSLKEGDDFWNELFHENFDLEEITLLSRVVVNGSNERLNYASLQNVVSDLLPKLEAAKSERKVLS